MGFLLVANYLLLPLNSIIFFFRINNFEMNGLLPLNRCWGLA